jgi:hypothetical protein
LTFRGMEWQVRSEGQNCMGGKDCQSLTVA